MKLTDKKTKKNLVGNTPYTQDEWNLMLGNQLKKNKPNSVLKAVAGIVNVGDKNVKQLMTL